MRPFVRTIHPRSVLSFASDSEPIPLTPLNVLIGPNGSGKSNLIEIFELLKALPTDLTEVIRDGGGIGEWFWKGEGRGTSATISAELQVPGVDPLLRYRLELGVAGQGVRVLDEAIEDVEKTQANVENWYFRYQGGLPTLRYRDGHITLKESEGSPPVGFDRRQSVLSQQKDPDLYREVTYVGFCFRFISTFREWGFGRYVPLRQPQPADLPNDVLLPDARNLGLILNAIEHSDAWPRLNAALSRFLPRFKRLSTLVQGGTIQIFLHEDGLRTPIPATRLSDGTIRFIALLAILLRPDAAPLICLEEPELGLHPDALAIIAELLVEASQETQIVVTTQSDVLVSALSEHAESVVVCENIAGASRFSRLESDKLRFWMEKYKLGEIWRMGELGGNP
ncbi:MAG: AAA family ATPase [Bryobacteraceae bacterium]|jgi:predicted ATPase